MNHKDVVRLDQRLSALFDKAQGFASDPELQSHWAKYLCVLTSGFLEQSIRILYREYCAKRAAKQVARYVSVSLSGFRNPKMGKILQLTRRFDKDWARQLESKCAGAVKDSIDSVMDNRHKIAHGESVVIGLVGMREYYRHARKVLDYIEEISAG